MASITTKNQKIILSGLRPTGVLHIGNYFGALLPLVKLQKTADIFLIMIADLHALTTLENTENLKKNSLALAAMYIAAGIDPKRAVIFVQSQVAEHAELAAILGMFTPLSMLELNPVYKEMKEEHPKQNNLGLLAYPVLQASDILLYKTTGVPVGKDQEPHIEFAREIARRFNSRFGEVFIEPKIILQKESKILSLQDPAKKMSKSHGEKTYISLLDSPETIREKIKIAVTDSGTEIKYDPAQKPAISNLITIYGLFAELDAKEIEKKFKGKNYSQFKTELADLLIEKLKPMREKYNSLMKKPDDLIKILENGAEKAKEISSQTLKEVRQKIGFL